ncbi:hypothetical protein ACXJJ3_12845 [Kribbella sp. WER1]
MTDVRWTGGRVRAVRGALRMSGREFANRVGVSERMITRWEARQEIGARPVTLAALDQVFEEMTSRQLELYAQLIGEPDSQLSRDDVAQARLSEAVSIARPSRAPVDESDVLAMQSFRSADRQVGGGHLYSAVVKYLNTDVGPRLFGGDYTAENSAIFTAAAGLTEMAGWMAHDAGRDDRAYNHFLRAFDLSKAGQDHQLRVHVLASMSHLAHHRAKPEEAIRFAQAGEQGLTQGPANPELSARVFAMQARGHAALGRERQTLELLGKAEDALGESHSEEPSMWVSHFDEGALASEAARCMRQLNKHAEAQSRAERIIELRPANRTRSRAFGQLFLSLALLEQREPEEACAVADEVIESTQSLGSHLVVQQLQDIQGQLMPYSGSSVVREFGDKLSDTLRQRLWLQQWLANDPPNAQPEVL